MKTTPKMARIKALYQKLRLFGSLKLTVLRAYYWNWRIPKDINLYIKRWNSIDHRRDKSWSGKDFRCWYYLRKLDEYQKGGENK